MSAPDRGARAFVDHAVRDPARAERVAALAAARWGLDRPVPIRVGMNGIYAAGDEVLRVGEPSVPAVVSLRLADFWLARGISVPEPARRDVFETDGLSVTSWRRIEPSAGDVDWAAVGAMIAAVHAVDPAELPAGVPLPYPEHFEWWHLDELLASVADLVDDDARAGLRAAIDAHRTWVHDDERVVCHGDVHPGNVMMTAAGPVLGDWDLLCWAPRGWDHAPLVTWHERWGGHATTYPDFCRGYGRSLADEPTTVALAELRLAAATLMRLRAGRSDGAARAEARRRLAYWRGEPDAPTWRAQ